MSLLGWTLAGGAAVAGVALLDRVAMASIRPPRRPPGRTAGELPFAHEEVRFGASVPLRGSCVEPESDVGGAVVALAHGWGANAGVMVPLADALARAGRPVLLFDYRGHGHSDDAPYVTVRHYLDDTRAAVAFARERWGRPVVLVGHSMGAAAAVVAAASDDDVAGLALVAGPADVLEVTASYFRRRRLPGDLMVALFKPFWRLRIGMPLRRLVPERRLPEVDVPVVIVQPEHDRSVSRGHAERLAHAAGSEVHLVPGADHADVLEDPETFRLVEELLERVDRGAPA